MDFLKKKEEEEKRFEGGPTNMTQYNMIHVMTCHECLSSVVQLYHLAMQKKQHLLKPPHVWIQTSHQTSGRFSSPWFFCTTRWSYCTPNFVVQLNRFPKKIQGGHEETRRWSLITEWPKRCCQIWTT